MVVQHNAGTFFGRKRGGRRAKTPPPPLMLSRHANPKKPSSPNLYHFCYVGGRLVGVWYLTLSAAAAMMLPDRISCKNISPYRELKLINSEPAAVTIRSVRWQFGLYAFDLHASNRRVAFPLQLRW